MSPGAETVLLKSRLTYTLDATSGREFTPDVRLGYGEQLTAVGDLTIKTDDTARTYINSGGRGRMFNASDTLGTRTNLKFDGGTTGLFLNGGKADQGGALLVRAGASVSTYNVNFQNNRAVGLSPVAYYTPNAGHAGRPDAGLRRGDLRQRPPEEAATRLLPSGTRTLKRLGIAESKLLASSNAWPASTGVKPVLGSVERSDGLASCAAANAAKQRNTTAIIACR